MSPSQYDALLKELKKGQIKTCIVKQNEKIEFEYYKNKKVEDGLHPINSCSKSIVSMLIGICIQEGLIPNLDVPINEYFGDYSRDNEDTRKDAITVFHLLTMTSGFNWPEFGEWNYWTPMEFSQNIVKSALERDLEIEPGVKMNYNSGSSNLLCAIIQKVSGMKTIDFANRYLFKPMGIEDYIWHEKQGINLGANGLRMKASDMLKLGALYLQEGQWNGIQLIPKEWVTESTKPRFITYPDIGHYGYHWWISDFKGEDNQKVSFYFALGLFGQFIIVVPHYNMVAVFVSENYSDTLNPLHLFREHIIPC
jgi:CubicO group peptidase (beta-lactamase class C family)